MDIWEFLGNTPLKTYDLRVIVTHEYTEDVETVIRIGAGGNPVARPRTLHRDSGFSIELVSRSPSIVCKIRTARHANLPIKVAHEPTLTDAWRSFLLLFAAGDKPKSFATLVVHGGPKHLGEFPVFVPLPPEGLTGKCPSPPRRKRHVHAPIGCRI